MSAYAHPAAILPIADRLQSNADEAVASCDRMVASLAELDAINTRQQRDFDRIFGTRIFDPIAFLGRLLDSKTTDADAADLRATRAILVELRDAIRVIDDAETFETQEDWTAFWNAAEKIPGATSPKRVTA